MGAKFANRGYQETFYSWFIIFLLSLNKVWLFKGCGTWVDL